MLTNEQLFEQAKTFIPGGVNSPVRAFNAVGGTPKFIAKSDGAYLYDVTGKKFIDYVGSWGPMILGHNHPKVQQAVTKAVTKGLSYGAPCIAEIQLAEKISKIMPNIEQVRMVNSGTEATMSAIRLARGFTSRDKIIKFEGCYHGHSDALLVKAGSGALTFNAPSSSGVPKSFTEHTLVARFNDIDSVKQLFEHFPNDIAAVIIEPVAGNMNLIPPKENFLTELRAVCDYYNSLLIFDEVMTGFRVALQGAQGLYNIKPDLTTLGKIIGGGMPVGAFGGRKEIMDCIAPLGSVYQAGTLSGNPIAMAAGLATLNILEQDPSIYENLTKNTAMLIEGLQELANSKQLAFSARHVGAMFGFYFNHNPQIYYYDQVTQSDSNKFNKFFHTMLAEGVYLAPSSFEAGFVSQSHTPEVITKTLSIAKQVFSTL